MFSYGNNHDAESNIYIYQKHNNKETVEETKKSIYEINKTVFTYTAHI